MIKKGLKEVIGKKEKVDDEQRDKTEEEDDDEEWQEEDVDKIQQELDEEYNNYILQTKAQFEKVTQDVIELELE